ncbi:hypothetical protein GCM10009613_05490 [Pseudonocardia kongjuensis]|uniref:Uncharacterized protein n=1 Tax=Pseudonocardia kongjuensis TaxID=102227 RepID=A0ABN1XGT9_9PSEU
MHTPEHPRYQVRPDGGAAAITGPTTGELLRITAFNNALNQDQACAVASILANVEVIDGNGSTIPADQKAALLDAVITTYRGELQRLAHAEGAPPSPTGTAAARRAAKVEAVGGADNVTPIRPDPAPDETA